MIIINQNLKNAAVEYLQYERDERIEDMIEGGYTREEFIENSPVWGLTDEQLFGLVDKFIIEETLPVIEANWKNFDEGDFDNAFMCYLWEHICN